MTTKLCVMAATFYRRTVSVLNKNVGPSNFRSRPTRTQSHISIPGAESYGLSCTAPYASNDSQSQATKNVSLWGVDSPWKLQRNPIKLVVKPRSRSGVAINIKSDWLLMRDTLNPSSANAETSPAHSSESLSEELSENLSEGQGSSEESGPIWSFPPGSSSEKMKDSDPVHAWFL